MGMNTAFLLGAGASAEAGLPLLAELTSRVERDLPRELGDVRLLYRRIADTAAAAYPESRCEASVETILSVIDSALQSRVPPESLTLRDLAFLGFEVRKAIWRVLARQRPFDDLDYLDGLLEFRRTTASLMVFSLNNDTVIEDWCTRRGIAICDGFDSEGEFDETRLSPDRGGMLTLVKLHGSVNWVRRPDGRVARLKGLVRGPSGLREFRSPLPELSLVFPSETKIVFENPYFELLELFRSYLRQADLLVVVGCALHDLHIVAAIRHAVRYQGLKVLVVDPRPGRALRALTPRSMRRHCGQHVDALPLGFGAALDGPICRAVKELPSEAAVFRLFFLDNTEESGRASLERLSRPRPAESEDWRSIASLVRLPEGVDGPWGAWGELHNAVRHARRTADTGSLLSHAAAARRERVPSGFCSNRGSVFATAQSHVWDVGRDWSPTTEVGPRIEGARDPVSIGGKLYVLQTRLVSRLNGPGALRRVDPETGRATYLGRDGKPLAATLVRLLTKVASRGGETAEDWRDRLKTRISDAGVLRWPSSLVPYDSERVVVVESRSASLVNLEHKRVERSSARRFLNLEHAAVMDPQQILLLEGGLTGYGRLWRWFVDEGGVDVLLENVYRGSGVAWVPDEEMILLSVGAESPDGCVLALSPATSDTPQRPHVLATNLHCPGRFFQTADGDWLCCTGHGPVRLRLASDAAIPP